MSWLSHSTGVHIGPRGTRFDGGEFKSGLGNLAKNVSPVAAFIPGLGLGVTAALAAGGEALRGHTDLASLAKAAGSNVAIGAGARGIAGHYGVLGQGGASEAAAAPTTAAPTPAPSPVAGSGLPTDNDLLASRGLHAPGVLAPPPVVPAPVSSPVASVGGSTASKGLGGKVLDFIGDHDKTSGAVLSGIGQIAAAGPQNRIANAQTRLADLQAEQQQQDLERRKAQDAALEPLRQAIYGRLGQTIGGAP